MPAQQERYLTARQVQERYQITEGTLYRHVANGVICKPHRIGRRNRWPESALLAQEREREARANQSGTPLDDWIEDELKAETGEA